MTTERKEAEKPEVPEETKAGGREKSDHSVIEKSQRSKGLQQRAGKNQEQERR